MARTVKDVNLASRTARLKLRAQKKPYWRALDQGRHVGYYKGARAGVWIARRSIGGSRYQEQKLGVADDTHDADGVEVLSFSQAQEQARTWFSSAATASVAGPLTVRQAVTRYIAYLEAEKSPKAACDSERRLERHVLPLIGDIPVRDLERDQVDRVKWAMAKVDEDADDDEKRRAKDTAHRVLNMLKAAPNRVFKAKKSGIPSDNEWRVVTPFKDVGAKREIFLSADEAQRLLNSCNGAFRTLVTAGLLTGARYGELTALRVRDFNAGERELTVIDGKTGPRKITLTAQGTEFFRQIAAGQAPDVPLLRRDDGAPWRYNDQLRPMAAAVQRAGLSGDTVFYSLRHSYASTALAAGMNLQVLAENLGTSVRMIQDHYGKFRPEKRRELIEATAAKFDLPSSNIANLAVRR
jgi:integrase